MGDAERHHYAAAMAMLHKPTMISIHIETRCDGGLRVWSNDVPHLVLSSAEREKLLADIPVALAEILKAVWSR